MKERPILFSGEMVRAILDSRKTQTRRAIKFPQRMIDDGQLPQIYRGHGDWPKGVGHEFYVAGTGNEVIDCPYGSPGDRLWVRETWANGAKQKETDPLIPRNGGDARWAFKADYDNYLGPLKWTPAIHMPRWASRITLEVSDVRVERLNAISFADCRAEGCRSDFMVDARGCMEADCNGIHYGEKYHYEHIWNALNKTHPWASNPWVWAISFKLITPQNSKVSDAMIAAGREG